MKAARKCIVINTNLMRRKSIVNMGTQIFYFIILFVGFSSCGNYKKTTPSFNVELIDDLDALNSRIKKLNFDIKIDANAQMLTDSPPLLLSLKLVAKVDAPIVQGERLQATKVVLDGGHAYVSYNMAGEKYIGAIDVFDNRTSIPKIISSLNSMDADINNLAVEKNFLYAVGGRESSGYLREFLLQDDKLTSNIREVSLPSYAGTGVLIKGDSIYSTSGSKGGLSAFNKQTLQQKFLLNLDDARDLAIGQTGNEILVLQGTPGRIANVSLNQGELISQQNLGGATTAEAKSTIQSGKNSNLVTLGETGVRIYCSSDNSLIASVSAPEPQGINAAKKATNSASAAKSLLFTADGEAGVHVYSMSKSATHTNNKCPTFSLTLIGSLNFGEKISANSVTFDGESLFVANGLGGLNIVKVSGIPEAKDDSDEY